MLEKISFEKKFILVLIIYFLFWMVIPPVFSSSFPLDVPEGIYWGKEFQLGYYKHPPFSSWILYSFYAVFGVFGPYILSQICISLTIFFVYLLGKNIVSKEKAFYSGIFVLSIFYYTWPSIEFNHNVAQMPIWAGLIYVFYLALKKNTWSAWLVFGVVTGIGMLTKYSVAILVFAIVLFSLLTSYRRLWLTAKPWVAVVVALALFSPHVWWLYQHDWLTFTYIQSRSHEDGGGVNHLAAFKYLASQIVNCLPLLLILLCNKSLSFKFRNIKIDDRNFLFFIGIFPGLFLFLLGLVSGANIRDMWASPMWSLVGLILVAMIPENIFQNHKKGLAKGLVIWLFIISVLMACYIQFGGQLRHKPSRMDWPQQELSLKAEQEWKQISHCQLDNIGGDNWLAILVATKMNQMPSVMMDTSAAYSPWMNLQRLEQKGSFMLWEKDQKPILPYVSDLEKNDQLVIYHGEWQITWAKVPNKQPLIIQWQAFVPKSCIQPKE